MGLGRGDLFVEGYARTEKSVDRQPRQSKEARPDDKNELEQRDFEVGQFCGSRSCEREGSRKG